MKNIWKQVGFSTMLLVLLLLSGCMTSARKLDKTAVIGQLHKGQTQAEVRQIFGQPRRFETGSNGNKLDVFTITFSMVPKAGRLHTTYVRSLHVLYNPEGRVENFSCYVGESKGYAVRPNEEWRSGHLLDEDKVNQIKRNATTYNELVQLFGPATVEGLDLYGNKTMSWGVFEGCNTSLTGGRELFVKLNADQVATYYLLRTLKP